MLSPRNWLVFCGQMRSLTKMHVCRQSSKNMLENCGEIERKQCYIYSIFLSKPNTISCVHSVQRICWIVEQNYFYLTKDGVFPANNLFCTQTRIQAYFIGCVIWRLFSHLGLHPVHCMIIVGQMTFTTAPTLCLYWLKTLIYSQYVFPLRLASTKGERKFKKNKENSNSRPSMLPVCESWIISQKQVIQESSMILSLFGVFSKACLFLPQFTSANSM